MKKGLLQAVSLLVAEHRVGLACAGWTIGEDSGIFAREDCFDEWLDGLMIDLF